MSNVEQTLDQMRDLHLAAMAKPQVLAGMVPMPP